MSSPEDQQKVRKAVSNRRLDISNIPATTKISDSNQLNAASVSGPNHKKRKAALEASQPAGSHVPPPQTSGSIKLQPLAEEEIEEDESQEEEPRDEVYCTMMTKIVGIQYYQGKQSSSHLFFFHYWIFTAGLVGAGEEVILVRQPHNEYDRSEWFPSRYRPKIN
jgi:SWI/SNF-related matrix-associated actin-dependent regulator of chromatin subfamily A3